MRISDWSSDVCSSVLYANDYLSNLFNKANLGFNAGNLVAGAGQTSSSKRKSKGGIGGLLGSAAGAIAASDRRLKINIHKVGEQKGLNLYQFRRSEERREGKECVSTCRSRC